MENTSIVEFIEDICNELYQDYYRTVVKIVFSFPDYFRLLKEMTIIRITSRSYSFESMNLMTSVGSVLIEKEIDQEEGQIAVFDHKNGEDFYTLPGPSSSRGTAKIFKTISVDNAKTAEKPVFKPRIPKW